MPCLCLSELTFFTVISKRNAKEPRFWRGSNSRPSACKADVITTTPQNLMALQSPDRKLSNVSSSNGHTPKITQSRFDVSVKNQKPPRYITCRSIVDYIGLKVSTRSGVRTHADICPLDLKSNALTTRPSWLRLIPGATCFTGIGITQWEIPEDFALTNLSIYVYFLGSIC